MRYRIIVGEKGNNQGHIVRTNAKSERGARIVLGRELAKYAGDGWGVVQYYGGDVGGGPLWFDIPPRAD